MQLTEHGLYVPERAAMHARAITNQQHLWKSLRRDSRLPPGAWEKSVPPISGGSAITGTWGELLYCNRVSFTAKNTFTTEVAINDTAAEAQAKIPADFFLPGAQFPKALRFVARGILGTTGSPTYTFTCRLGAAASITAVIVLGSAATTAAATVSNQLWAFQGDVIVRTLGTTGATATGNGLGWIESPGGFASPFQAALFGGGAQPGTFTTLDPTIANFVNFNVACSASSASNTITLLQLLVFGLN